VEADELKARLHFSPEFAQKLADTIAPGTTVIVTDQAVVRKPVADPTVFEAVNPAAPVATPVTR
jgi:hypothetical protein